MLLFHVLCWFYIVWIATIMVRSFWLWTFLHSSKKTPSISLSLTHTLRPIYRQAWPPMWMIRCKTCPYKTSKLFMILLGASEPHNSDNKLVSRFWLHNLHFWSRHVILFDWNWIFPHKPLILIDNTIKKLNLPKKMKQEETGRATLVLYYITLQFIFFYLRLDSCIWVIMKCDRCFILKDISFFTKCMKTRQNCF